MKVRMTASLMATMTLLKLADSRMPRTSRTVMITTITMAGTFRTAPVLVHPSKKSR